MVSSRGALSKELGRIKSFSKPKLSLRQYMTPPGIASELLWTAFMNGDISDRIVYDLGCGTGMLTIGASLLDGVVYGFDIDPDAISEAIINAKSIGVNVLIYELDINDVKGPCNTVVMNPPFMVKGGVNDRVFLEKAFGLCHRVYSIHTSQTREWVRKFAKDKGFDALLISTREFPLPAEFAHHTKEKGAQQVDLWFFKKLFCDEF